MLVPLALGVLVVVGLALTANPRELARSLRDFDLRLLVPVLALSLFNYALRYIRWEIYLRRVGVPALAGAEPRRLPGRIPALGDSGQGGGAGQGVAGARSWEAGRRCGWSRRCWPSG